MANPMTTLVDGHGMDSEPITTHPARPVVVDAASWTAINGQSTSTTTPVETTTWTAHQRPTEPIGLLDAARWT
jgi:hypothetical protein